MPDSPSTSARDNRATPTLRRYIVNDATVEKLGEVLNENDRGVLHHRDELMGFFRGHDREGHEQDRAFYLEAFNGTGDFSYDRVKRGSAYIKAACVSMLGTIQPGPLAEIMADSLRGGSRDDGLAQRFQLLVYPDISADWKFVDRAPDAEYRNAVLKAARRLAMADFSKHGATPSEDGIPFLRFDEDAQPVANDWLSALERKLRVPDEHPAMVAHLAKYRSLMPKMALLIHLSEWAEADEAARLAPISLKAAKRAQGWCDYLEAHARRCYGVALSNGDRCARALSEKIRLGRLPPVFTARVVYEKGWSGLTVPEDVRRALGVLEQLDWVRSVETATLGRPKMTYIVNPRLTKADEPGEHTAKPSEPAKGSSAGFAGAWRGGNSHD